MNFTAIDFETANANTSSVCQIGIAVVENGQVVEKLSWLVRPPELLFNRFNTYVHGIRASDVENEPEFNQLWSKIKPYLDGKTIIAHNSSFDIAVLRGILDVYGIEYPTFDYCCSVKIAKKVWTEIKQHGLKSLSSYLSIEFNHHEAGEDAYAAAQIVIEAAKQMKAESFKQLLDILEIRPGHLFPGGYVPSHQLNQFNLKKADPSKLDPEHPFYSQTVVFTGALECMERKNAMQLIANVGGICAASVNEHTNFLILGNKVLGRLKDNYKTSKILKAEALVKKGFSIETISEADFKRLIKSGKDA